MSLLQVTFPDDVLAIGTKVFVPRPTINQVHEDEITGYECVLQRDGEELLLYPTYYLLTTSNNDNATEGWKRDQFCLSREEAQSKCKIYRVTRVLPEDWVHSIGLDPSHDNPTFYEKCELGDCCETTTSIRSILFDLAMSGQLESLRRDTLAKLIESHEPPVTKPILDRILTQLDIVWNITNEKPAD